MVQDFLGGADENWFVMVHVAIEAEAGVLLEDTVRLVAVANAGDEREVERLLVEMNEGWKRICGHFSRMQERCDPYIYLPRVRP